MPGPRQKAQFMIDLFLLNDFWLKSGKRERRLLEEMHFNPNSSVCFAVATMVSKEKMTRTKPTPWHPAQPNPPRAYLCVCAWRLRCPTHTLKRLTETCTARLQHGSSASPQCRMVNLSPVASHGASRCPATHFLPTGAGCRPSLVKMGK